MVLVVGQNSPLVSAICRDAKHAQVPCAWFQTRSGPLDRGALFERLLAVRASALVAVDVLRRLATEPDPGELLPLEEVVGAAIGAGVNRLVVVTSREQDDPALRHLRRSGLPYVVLRCSALAEWEPTVDLASLTSRKVLVGAELLEQAAPAVGVRDVLCRVQEALVRDDILGRSMTVEPIGETHPIVALLEASGAEPVDDDGWRGRIANWFGRPRVDITADGYLKLHTHQQQRRKRRSEIAEVAMAQ